MLQILLLCSLFCSRYSVAIGITSVDENLTLDLVQVIFRHGERVPIAKEAKFINVTDPSMYEADFGQLTKKGMMQEYTLGRMLRKSYDEYLGLYDENEVVAETTSSSRTKMSLELVLAGLFSPTPEEQWHSELKWRPIPYDTIAKSVSLAPHDFKKFMDLYRKSINASEEYRKGLSKYVEFIKSLEKWTGYSYFDNVLYNTGFTCSLIHIHKLTNSPLPDWCTDEVYNTCQDVYKFLIYSMSITEELKKLNGGTLVRRVVENVESNEQKKKKIYLFSTHDLTLIAFTVAQDVINAFEAPPFGSAYIVESYKDSQQQYYIRVLSWDGSSDHFVELQVNNCDKYCPVEKYKSLVKHVTPTDEDLKFFDLDASSPCGTSSGISLTIIVLGTIVITIIVFFVITILYKKLRT